MAPKAAPAKAMWANTRSESMNLIEQLKNLNIEKTSLDEMILLSASARALNSEYEANGTVAPEWLSDARRMLGREIKVRTQNQLEMRLRELEAADAADRTASERRADRAKEREKIEAALGKTVAV